MYCTLHTRLPRRTRTYLTDRAIRHTELACTHYSSPRPNQQVARGEDKPFERQPAPMPHATEVQQMRRAHCVLELGYWAIIGETVSGAAAA